MARVFDPALPFVASGGLFFDGKRYADGAPFPWRELGVHEHALWEMWSAGHVDTRAGTAHVPNQPPSPRHKGGQASQIARR